MSLLERGVPTVADVIRHLELCPKDAHVLIYQELPDIEMLVGKCLSGIMIVSRDANEDSPAESKITFITTGRV